VKNLDSKQVCKFFSTPSHSVALGLLYKSQSLGTCRPSTQLYQPAGEANRTYPFKVHIRNKLGYNSTPSI
jgi:hypothetical protein